MSYFKKENSGDGQGNTGPHSMQQRTSYYSIQSGFLTHYDLSRPVKLKCDASPYGIGACLSHEFEDGSERPVAFASRTLSSAEKSYAQIEREALAITFGVRHFHKFLIGQRFTLVTDHKPLVKILGPKQGIPALAAARL